MFDNQYSMTNIMNGEIDPDEIVSFLQTSSRDEIFSANTQDFRQILNVFSMKNTHKDDFRGKHSSI